MNIEARYPDYKDKLFQSLSEDKCQNIINNTMELHKWTKTKL
jgi:hypothetical protein